MEDERPIGELLNEIFNASRQGAMNGKPEITEHIMEAVASSEKLMEIIKKNPDLTMKLSDEIGRALVGAVENGHREIVVALMEIIKTNPDLIMKLSDRNRLGISWSS